MSRYWNDGDWSDYEGKSVGWGLLLLLFYLGSIKIHEFGWAYFCKKRLVDLIVALWLLEGGWFLCFVIAFFLSCINLDWFFNRDQQQINKVDCICHRKQHFGPKLARPRNRLLHSSFTYSLPTFRHAFLSFNCASIFTFSFVISVFFPNCLLTFFLFFFPCPLVAVAMVRHTKLSPSASCMTEPYVKVARALTEYYRGALYLISYHLQFYTQLTLNRLSW